MKFHSAFLFLFGAGAAAAKHEKNFKVIENFLTEDEINSYRQVEVTEKGIQDNRRLGRAHAESDLIRRLEDAGAVAPGQESAHIRTSLLTESSAPHTDIGLPEEGGMFELGEDDNVVFVFLNDNPDAKFIFGDESVPVVAGNMVAFNGHQVEHSTVVEKGEVHLLGPFESRNLGYVGTTGEYHTGAFGDPHFRTWRGEKYDFHGQCDLELVSDPTFLGKGIQVAIRTKIVRNWSKIDVAAIRIGDDVLEVQGEADEQKYWVNSVYQGELTNVGGFPVSYKRPHSKGHLYTISLGGDNDDKIEVRTFKDMVRVDFLKPSLHLYGNTVGLLGDFATGQRFARDGVTVIEDPIQFGQEWQVQPDGPALFHEVAGPQLPHQKCVMPEDLKVADKRRRRLGASQVTERMAEVACQHLVDAQEDFDACVFDVLAADDVDMAGAY